MYKWPIKNQELKQGDQYRNWTLVQITFYLTFHYINFIVKMTETSRTIK